MMQKFIHRGKMPSLVPQKNVEGEVQEGFERLGGAVGLGAQEGALVAVEQKSG
jgi:hypothetical protein